MWLRHVFNGSYWYYLHCIVGYSTPLLLYIAQVMCRDSMVPCDLSHTPLWVSTALMAWMSSAALDSEYSTNTSSSFRHVFTTRRNWNKQTLSFGSSSTSSYTLIYEQNSRSPLSRWAGRATRWSRGDLWPHSSRPHTAWSDRALEREMVISIKLKFQKVGGA